MESYIWGVTPNLGKTLCPLPPITIRPRRTVRDPLPEIRRFDTDIGAFIESSTMPSTKGSMAPSIVNNDAVQRGTFLPGQIFIFGGFILRANSLGHLEQIDSYAPGHQVRFGNLNYTADMRGDLIFDGFEPVSGAPNNHDVRDLDLQSDSIRNIAPATAPDFVPEQVVPSEDGWMDPAT